MMRLRWILLFAVIAFAFARLTGAHLHLCFDGSEPPLELHTSDSAYLDHHSSESQPHDDLDVDALSEALYKTAKVDLPDVALLVALLLVLLPPVRRLAPMPGSYRVPDRPPTFLLPPLRAPPI